MSRVLGNEATNDTHGPFRKVVGTTIGGNGKDYERLECDHLGEQIHEDSKAKSRRRCRTCRYEIAIGERED